MYAIRPTIIITIPITDLVFSSIGSILANDQQWLRFLFLCRLCQNKSTLFISWRDYETINNSNGIANGHAVSIYSNTFKYWVFYIGYSHRYWYRQIDIHFIVREATKKLFFLVATKALPPPPTLELFLRASKKILSGQLEIFIFEYILRIVCVGVPKSISTGVVEDFFIKGMVLK